MKPWSTLSWLGTKDTMSLEAVFSTKGKAEAYLKKNFARTGYIIERDVL